jgi:hypothetical protein
MHHSTKILTFLLVSQLNLLVADPGSAVPDKSAEQALERMADPARYWQYGWTGVFLGSVVLQARTLSQPKASAEARFDARMSLITSSSGLLSTLVNPLPAALLSDYRQLPDITPEDKIAKQREAYRILRETEWEIERRQGWAFHALLLTEQVLAAGAIAWIDGRPQDAARRFVLGTITSGLFIYTLPQRAVSSHNGAPQLSWRLAPEGVALQLDF